MFDFFILLTYVVLAFYYFRVLAHKRRGVIMTNQKYFLVFFITIFLSMFSSNLFADILDDIVAEINYVRTRPQEYALKRLTPMLKKYKGKNFYESAEIIIETEEGVAPCLECIEVLKKQKPLCPLTMDNFLCIAAKMHAEDQMRTGQVGHEGSDGSQMHDRIKKAGFRGTAMGENIAYGCRSAIEIVAGLMIDDGVPDRGHRVNFLDPDYDRVGVAYGKGQRATYGTICVIEMGGGVQNTSSSGQSNDKRNQNSTWETEDDYDNYDDDCYDYDDCYEYDDCDDYDDYDECDDYDDYDNYDDNDCGSGG